MWKDDNTKQYCSSFELYDLGDVEYILLEAYECNSKDELRARERYWIEQNINNVVNIIKRPITSKEEINQRKKDYYVENKKYFETKHKEYALEHKVEIDLYRLKWKAENKKKYDKARKKWADENRELINQRAKERRLQKKAANN